MIQGARELCGVSFIRTLINSRGLHSHELSTSQRPHILIPSPLGVRMSPYEIWWHKYSARSTLAVLQQTKLPLWFAGWNTGMSPFSLFFSDGTEGSRYPDKMFELVGILLNTLQKRHKRQCLNRTGRENKGWRAKEEAERGPATEHSYHFFTKRNWLWW